MDIWGKGVLGCGNSTCKGPEVVCTGCSNVSGTERSGRKVGVRLGRWGAVVEQILGVLWVTTGTLMFSWEEMGAMGGF